MTVENQDNNSNPDNQDKGNTGDPSIDKLVAEKVEAALADIKGKLNNAYSARDEANTKLAKLELDRKEAELKRLEEEGKHIEVANQRLTESNAKVKALEEQNTNLTRDVNVRSVLNGYQFRSEKAAEMAFKEVIGQLVKNEQGNWVHKTGVGIKDFVDAFSKDEEQSFLFKAKVSTGGGSSNSGVPNTGNSSDKKSLFSMSQAEVLKMAAEGKFSRN
jgi:hypothetical protein